MTAQVAIKNIAKVFCKTVAVRRLLLLFVLFVTPVAHALETVNLQLKWTHTFQFAGYYLALERGYYRDVGLDVKILEAQPDTDPVAAVLSGQAQFGVGMSSLLLHRNAGQAVVALAVIFQHSPQVLIQPEKQGITTVLNLAGRRIMLEPHSDELLALLQREGVALAGIHRQPHSFNLKDLTDGRTDAMSAYLTNEPYFLRKQGFAFQTLSPRIAGIDFYGDNLFTSQAEIDRNPERVAAFREASLRGWREAMANPEPVIELIHQKYAPQLDVDFLRFEAAAMNELLRTDLIEVGYMNPGRWQHIAATYTGLGLLAQDVDLRGFLYTQPVLHSVPIWAFFSLALVLVIGLASVYVLKLNRRLTLARDAALAANRFKSKFLARVSHDLRAPLHTLLGYADLAQRAMAPNADNTRAHAMLAAMERSGQSLTDLIDELLQFARGEEGRLRLEPRATYLAAMAHTVIEQMQPQAHSRGNQLTLVTDIEVPVVWVDDVRLRQVLQNLIANACYATQDGTVILSISSQRAMEVSASDHTQAVSLHFAVADTGRGIAPHELDHVFQPFQQGSKSAQGVVPGRHGPGFGLGLAICRQWVQLMGSSITVTSERRQCPRPTDNSTTLWPGRGSVFGFTLQSTEAAEDEVQLPIASWTMSPGKPGYAGKVRCILVVDDAPAHRELMLDLLTSQNFDVLQASSAHQAIQVLQGQQGTDVNLVLTDQHMPNGNGWDLLNWCRQNAPALLVVCLSAAPASRASPDDQKHRPFDAQLLKPVRYAELLQVIGQLLKLEYFEQNEPLATVNTAQPATKLVANEMGFGTLRELRQLVFEGRGLEVDAWLVRHGASLAPSMLQEILPLAATLQHARMLKVLPLDGQ